MLKSVLIILCFSAGGCRANRMSYATLLFKKPFRRTPSIHRRSPVISDEVQGWGLEGLGGVEGLFESYRVWGGGLEGFGWWVFKGFVGGFVGMMGGVFMRGRGCGLREKESWEGAVGAEEGRRLRSRGKEPWEPKEEAEGRRLRRLKTKEED